MKNKIELWLYRWIYAPIMSMIEDYKHRNAPPLPPLPCQICGKPEHKERFCPNTKALGYFDE